MSGNFDKSKDNLNKNAPKPETESNHRVESHTIERLSKQALDQYIEKHPTAKSQVDVSGLNGNFSSPDGAKKLKVVDGALLDSSGSRLGQLHSDGKIVLFDSSAGPKGKHNVSDANLFFNNWKFSGKERNQKLEFTTNKDASNGLITISSPEAKSVLGLAIDNTPAKLTIKCGMVLDGSGKQIGHFIPPRLENGILQGGFVKPLKSEGYFQLNQAGPATVDVQVLGQTGQKGQRLQCIYSVDGKLLDVNALVANKAEQLKKLSEEVKELTFEHKNIFELATGALTGSHEELRK